MYVWTYHWLILITQMLLASRVSGSSSANPTESTASCTDGFTDEDAMIAEWEHLEDPLTCPKSNISDIFQTATVAWTFPLETCAAMLTYNWDICCKKRPKDYYMQRKKSNMCATVGPTPTSSDHLITITSSRSESSSQKTTTSSNSSHIPSPTRSELQNFELGSAIDTQSGQTVSSELATSRTESSSSQSTATIGATPVQHTKKKTDRFNYASFDCGALILDSNKEASSATSILIKNRDQYMLNKCSANKYVIVELCQEILVRGISMANFEFFSSMFKTFQVYVSDRYPPKTDWVRVGTFTAQNSREIQEFVIENPVIWSKYLKIEFVSHYGKEFYCPLSVLNVYGTSMLEDVRAVEQEFNSGLYDVPSYEDAPPSNVTIPKDLESTASSIPVVNKSPADNTSTLLHNTTVSSEVPAKFYHVTTTLSEEIANLAGAATLVPQESPDSISPDQTQASATTSLSSTSSEPTPSISSASKGQPTSTQTSLSSTGSQPVPSVAPISAQESIFKTIMKRLQSLERNMTQLSREFAEQYGIHPSFFGQMEVIREEHKKLNEDVRQMLQTFTDMVKKVDDVVSRIEKQEISLAQLSQKSIFSIELLVTLSLSLLSTWLVGRIWNAFTPSVPHSPKNVSHKQIPSANESLPSLDIKQVTYRVVQTPISFSADDINASLTSVIPDKSPTTALQSPIPSRKSKKRKRKSKQNSLQSLQ